MHCVCRIAVLLVVFATTAEAQTPEPKIPVTIPDQTEVLSAEATGSSAPPASVALEQPIQPDKYICGPGDVFELNFWGQQNFRLRIAVDLEGRTFISKVGFVKVAGKTLAEVRDDIKKKVGGSYPGLKFDLTLVNLRSFLVHVVGNVKQPASYPAHAVDRASTILAHAGGSQGSRRRISIKRRSGTVVTADLLMYELTGDTSYNPYLLDGDVINVPFAQTTVSIAGAVRRPGTYELVKTTDLAELLELAGGFTSSVAKTLPIRIVRGNDKNQQSFVDVPFAASAAPNAALRDNDAVLVRSTEEYQRSVLLIGAVAGADQVDTATTSRRLPYVEGDTVLSIITRAGGIKAPADLRRSYIARPSSSGSDPQVIAVDLDALLVQRNFKADKPVLMGDTIVVPPMQYSVLIEGAVPRPGMYNYNPMFGINEYIARAGGRSRVAKDLDDVKIVDSQGHTLSYRSSLKPKPGDSIVVPERTFTRAEIVQLAIAGTSLLLSGITVAYVVTR
jgi:polysaccharide biosynthesis/export protein